jgi:hypothetical protein
LAASPIRIFDIFIPAAICPSFVSYRLVDLVLPYISDSFEKTGVNGLGYGRSGVKGGQTFRAQ